MINPFAEMMGPKILVLRGHTDRHQFRFPRSKRRRIRKKWATRDDNYSERFVPPPIRDDEFIVVNGNALFPMGNIYPFDPFKKDASQTTAGPQTICCTPAGEALLRESLGLSA